MLPLRDYLLYISLVAILLSVNLAIYPVLIGFLEHLCFNYDEHPYRLQYLYNGIWCVICKHMHFASDTSVTRRCFQIIFRAEYEILICLGFIDVNREILNFTKESVKVIQSIMNKSSRVPSLPSGPILVIWNCLPVSG